MAINSLARETIAYENCRPSDHLFGEKLSSIINYVNKLIGIHIRRSESSASQFIRYSEAYSNILNQPVENLEVRKYIDHPSHGSGRDLFGLIRREHYFWDEFFVFKVFRFGNSLDVIPTYIFHKKTINRKFFRKRTYYDSIRYDQKFRLPSAYLKDIIDRIKQDALDKWI